ncbi:two-component system, sporulation sensor kinase A [Methanosarcinales archaeon]|nr:two-component system, sporulation sensor kinase A [Methanosarcinales archaeon]
MSMDKNIKLKALSDIASIDITSGFDEIFQKILSITCKSMNANSGTIILVDEETGELRMVSSFGLREDYIEQVHRVAREAGVPLSSSPSGAVLKTGHYYVVPNIYIEPLAGPWCKLAKIYNIRSQLFIPMKKGLKVIGLLNVYMSKVHDFTEAEIDFVTIAASQASSIIQNARCTEDKIKEIYNKLYKSEKYLKTIIDSSIDGITVVNMQGEIEFGNDSFFNIVGWPKDELLGQSFIKMLPQDVKEDYIKIWHEAQNSLNSGKIADVKIITKKGEIRYLLNSRAEMVFDGVKKFLFIAKDITKQKKIELELEESEAKFRDLFENANDFIYTHDLKGNILSINKIGLKLLDVTEEEIIGSNIKQWVTPESYKKVEDRFRKIFSNQPLEPTVVIEAINKKGEHKWGEARTRLIKDGDKIIGTHGIMRDITEKMKLEKDLKESEEKYRDLFENAQEPMYVLDTQGNFLKMNRVGLQTLGCKKEEVIGTNINKWVTPESLKIVEERRKKRLSGEKLNQIDTLEIMCKNGEHRWVEISTRQIKEGDRTIEIHGIARDVTENRLLKQELKKSNKQQKLLCYLIKGTRGGKTRALILKHLSDKSYNANQLATALNMDYKTIRHHLNVLIKNGIIAKSNDGYSDLYFIPDNIDVDEI